MRFLRLDMTAFGGAIFQSATNAVSVLFLDFMFTA